MSAVRVDEQQVEVFERLVAERTEVCDLKPEWGCSGGFA